MPEAIPRPTHCFCEIPKTEMLPWVIKRYKKNIQTVDLISSTHDPHQKEIIGIVGLLDVDEQTLIMLTEGIDKPQDHIIECRRQARQLLDYEK